MDAVRSLIEAGVSVWLDPDAPVKGAGEDLVSWLAGKPVTGVGPSLPAARSPRADRQALAAFADANPLRSVALAHSARLVERIAIQLSAVHSDSGGSDGLVQFPSPPDVWGDPRALVALAGDLSRLTSAANVVIGLPFNSAGLTAAQELVFRGVSIALGPVFSPTEYRRAGNAYRRGLERRVAAGESLAELVSVVWIPVRAIDDYVAELLGPVGPLPYGQIGATIAERIYLESFQSLLDPRWRRLRAAGATRQRPAFCDLPAGKADELRRLILPGSILALSRRVVGALRASPSLPLAEPDETEVDWTLREARREGLRLVAMSAALRARFEVRGWPAWWLRTAGVDGGGAPEWSPPCPIAAGCWP